MFTKKSAFSILSVLLVILMISGTASARSLDAPLGTGFTYQGNLSDAGVPANGPYDLEFKLYDALSGGSQVGSAVSQNDVAVTKGLFTVQLDFGNVFDGTPLYLEIGVRAGASVGAYTTLTPRQPLSATPYALYALKAPWSGISGMPGGFADGVDNGASYQNIKVVAKSGGDFTTITAALNSITDASANNPYLVYVAPGVYTEQVTMKPFVDIEGAGELTTKITFTGSATKDTGTLIGANSAELRFLTVENTGGNLGAIGIYNNSAAPRLTHVTVNASGGTFGSYGIYNDNLSSPRLTNVTASASGGADNNAVYNEASSPTINNSILRATSGAHNYGIYNHAAIGSYTVLVNNSQISGSTNTILNDTSFTTLVGASQLDGGVALNLGILTCAGVYDEAYAFFANTCP